MSKRMTRRDLLRFAGLTGSAALVAACKPEVVEVTKIVKEVVKETVIVEKEAPTAAPKEAVTVRFHSRIGEQEDKLYEIQMPKFMEANPHITVVKESFPGGEYGAKIATMLAGGTLGDVVWAALRMACIHVLYSQGMVRSIDELVAGENFDLDQYYKGTIRALTLENKLLGLPFKAHPSDAFIYYNQALYEKADVPIPTATWKHEDMDSAAKAIRGIAGDQPIFGGTLTTAWRGVLVTIRSFGGEMISEDGSKLLLTEDPGMAAMQRLYDYFQTLKVAPSPEQVIGSTYQMWVTGYLGMYQAGTWASVLGNTIGNKFKWMAVSNPLGPGGVGGSDFEVDCYSITTASKNPDAAFEWLKYLTNQDSGVLLGVIGGTIGGRPDAYNSPVLLRDPMRVVFRDVMEKAQANRIMANYRLDECEAALAQLTHPLWAGEEKPTKAFIGSIEEQIQEIMDKPKP